MLQSARDDVRNAVREHYFTPQFRPPEGRGMIEADTRFAYSELETRLRRFVVGRVPAADVDDVVQDVFLRFQRSLSDLRHDERFESWVYQVARSAIAEQRRQRARHPITHADPPEIASEWPDAADEGAVERDLATYVAPFVAQLPSPYREALTLVELEGLTQKAAADLLGISLSGMKSRVQRGRARLRKVFEGCCEIALDTRGHVIGCEPRTAATTSSAAAMDRHEQLRHRRVACGKSLLAEGRPPVHHGPPTAGVPIIDA